MILSIIVPVYNSERFLPHLIDSILLQSFKNFEMIVVNDGSTDKTAQILADYAATDERIKVINKSNEGVAIARNAALDIARGEYVYFVDADDLVYPDCLRVLLANNNATFVKADFIPINENGDTAFINKKKMIRQKYAGRVMDADSFDRCVLMGEYFLWTCLFRRDIIENNNIRFIPHCRLMEDAAFMVAYLVHSPRNMYVDAFVYGYRKYGDTASVVKRDYSVDLEMILTFLDSLPDKMFVNHLRNEVEWVMKSHHGTPFQKIMQKNRQRLRRIVIYIKYMLSK